VKNLEKINQIDMQIFRTYLIFINEELKSTNHTFADLRCYIGWIRGIIPLIIDKPDIYQEFINMYERVANQLQELILDPK
jgi:hypothetical protein